MKKSYKWVAFALTIIFMLQICMPVFAKVSVEYIGDPIQLVPPNSLTVTDSRNVSDEELEQLEIDENKEVVKIYRGEYIYDFAKKTPIREALGIGYEIQYLYKSDSDIHIKMFDKSGGVKEKKIEYDSNSRYSYFYDIATSPKAQEKLFKSVDATKGYDDIEINEIYLMIGRAYEYIYFVTNHGDYVYNRRFYTSLETPTKRHLVPAEIFSDIFLEIYSDKLDEREYLMPFYSFGDQIDEKREKEIAEKAKTFYERNFPDIGKYYEGTKYLVKTSDDTYLPVILISVSAVIIISGAVVTVVCVKRKKKARPLTGAEEKPE